ncbi:MAG TPA: adenosylcobinamide-GDP ribazoletransferase, partial [Atribacteraceae bacterium]|nr:adenosylcobinamide-GDP ribazoletransferase [Atribacteraceae bacterium]
NLGAWRFVLAATGDRMIAALTVVLVWIGLTRALHLDGAADIADALFGGWTPEQRRSILADSRLGTFGVVAVFVLLAGKLVFVFGLATSFPLVLAPVLGRTAALYMGILFPPLPLGGKGMGKEISGRIPAWYGLLWVAIVAGFSLAQGGRTLLKTAVIFIMIYLFGRALVRTLEGVNGDGLGAGVEWAEFLFLFLQRA